MVTVQTIGGAPQFTGPEQLAVEANISSAGVTTAGWHDNSCPITHYSVAYKRVSTSTWVVGKFLNYTTQLTSGTHFQFITRDIINSLSYAVRLCII